MPIDQDDFERKFKLDQEFKPSPAVCTRSANRHEPEVAFDGSQYVVGPAEATREAAEAIAERVAGMIRNAMLQKGRDLVSEFRKAKP